MKTFNCKLLSIVAALVSLVAVMFVSTASCIMVYQPKAPKSLKKN